jgi:hypothetical protein
MKWGLKRWSLLFSRFKPAPLGSPADLAQGVLLWYNRFDTTTREVDNGEPPLTETAHPS